MLPVAMVALVLVEHGPLVLGLILGTRGVAGSLSALVTGAFVSKVRKSTALAMSDLVQCAVMLGFAFGPDGAAWLLALAALGGVAGSVGEPASGSIMPLLVPGARLQEANALRTIVGRAMGITGPAAAGMLSVVMDARTVFLIVAASFALGSAVLLRVREEPPPVRRASATMGADLRKGLRGGRRPGGDGRGAPGAGRRGRDRVPHHVGAVGRPRRRPPGGPA